MKIQVDNKSAHIVNFLYILRKVIRRIWIATANPSKYWSFGILFFRTKKQHNTFIRGYERLVKEIWKQE
jgi:hypothetical protein